MQEQCIVDIYKLNNNHVNNNAKVEQSGYSLSRWLFWSFLRCHVCICVSVSTTSMISSARVCAKCTDNSSIPRSNNCGFIPEF